MTNFQLSPDHKAQDELQRVVASGVGDDRDVPADVEPGSDADVDPDDEDEDSEDAGSEAAEPSPDDVVTESGQMDDNIDDLGRRPDGSRQEQPGISK